MEDQPAYPEKAPYNSCLLRALVFSMSPPSAPRYTHTLPFQLNSQDERSGQAPKNLLLSSPSSQRWGRVKDFHTSARQFSHLRSSKVGGLALGFTGLPCQRVEHCSPLKERDTGNLDREINMLEGSP